VDEHRALNIAPARHKIVAWYVLQAVSSLRVQVPSR
jgi:hypothetical protein